MATLIVYYSLSGTTRTVATTLAQQLGADIEEIRCRRYAGFWGSLRAVYDAWAGKVPSIEPLNRPLSDYDLVVIGGPIWVFHPATPVLAFLGREAARLSTTAFFLTHGGSAGPESLRAMEQRAGRAPVGTLLVRAADVKSGKFRSAVSSFASTLRAAKTRVEPRAA